MAEQMSHKRISRNRIRIFVEMRTHVATSLVVCTCVCVHVFVTTSHESFNYETRRREKMSVPVT